MPDGDRKKTLLLTTLIVLATSSPDAVPATAAGPRWPSEATRERVPVLVELFTSEGCSSCPPADLLLARLQRAQPVAGAEIVPLSLHVDYWNHLGWRDPFSDAAYSERQRRYAARFGTDRIYTPQMVVDGEVELVGGNEARAERAIQEAARRAKGRLELTAARERAGELTLRLRVLGLPAPRPGAEVWLAVTEDGLATDVPRGENAGRRLPHAAVVRELVSLGRIRTQDSVFEGTRVLGDAAEARGRRSAIGFVQEAGSGRILAVARLPL